MINNLEISDAVKRCAVAYDNPDRVYKNEQVVFTKSPKGLTVSIAGSNDIIDWLQNVKTKQVKLGKWWLSEGVLNAAKNVVAMANEYRAADGNEKLFSKPLSFEGHSKGGAVAIACGMISVVRHNKVSRVITFAAPRITTLKSEYPFPLFQFVASGDPIPNLPPWRPWKRWRHNGRVTTVGRQSVAEFAARYSPFVGPIRKHLIKNYVSLFGV